MQKMEYSKYIDKYHKREKILTINAAVSLVLSIIFMVIIISYTIKGENAGIYSLLGMISSLSLTVNSSMLIRCSHMLRLKNIVKNTDLPKLSDE